MTQLDPLCPDSTALSPFGGVHPLQFHAGQIVALETAIARGGALLAGIVEEERAAQTEANRRITRFWTQIGQHFRDHDDLLLFAGTNEVMVEGDYSPPKPEYVEVQNGFNQTFVDAVRAAAGLAQAGVELAELARERDLLVLVERLVAEHEHGNLFMCCGTPEVFES